MRCFSALYRILDDCDEVYNYWEPTHYLLQGYGRETWEYSTDYKIRSWAFIFVNALIGLITKVIASTKVCHSIFKREKKKIIKRKKNILL
jgi:alpha-1,2-mannosyltransferase